MEESTYQLLVDRVFRAIQDPFDTVDPDEIDVFMGTSDVVTLAFKNGVRCIVNTQRPVRQIWLAARARAWHFSYDPEKKQWFDDKGHGLELFNALKQIVKEESGLDIVFQPPA